MSRLQQRVLHCGCGDPKVVKLGLCATCYTLRRQDEEYFGGLREAVLERDGRMCRVCAELPEVERLCVGLPPCVHHRVPGRSKLHLMITLCLAHHAMVTRTSALLKEWPELLRVLWREQHPKAHEQRRLNFKALLPPAQQMPLLGGGDHEKEKQGIVADSTP